MGVHYLPGHRINQVTAVSAIYWTFWKHHLWNCRTVQNYRTSIMPRYPSTPLARVRSHSLFEHMTSRQKSSSSRGPTSCMFNHFTIWLILLKYFEFEGIETYFGTAYRYSSSRSRQVLTSSTNPSSVSFTPLFHITLHEAAVCQGYSILSV